MSNTLQHTVMRCNTLQHTATQVCAHMSRITERGRHCCSQTPSRKSRNVPIISVLQCVAVCCSVLQCVAVCCSVWKSRNVPIISVLQCVAVCCSVLQFVAVCCRVLQCVAVCCSVLQCVAVCCSVLQCVAVCCSVLQCVAVCCSLLQYGKKNSRRKFSCGPKNKGSKRGWRTPWQKSLLSFKKRTDSLPKKSPISQIPFKKSSVLSKEPWILSKKPCISRFHPWSPMFLQRDPYSVQINKIWTAKTCIVTIEVTF